MFVYNFKINGAQTFKRFFTAILVIILIIVGVVITRVFSGAYKSDYDILKNSTQEIQANNYTNILKAVTDDIDEYIGTKFTFTGYVYRMYDFKENQFVLARDMIISSNSQSVVVGFLCESKNAGDFENDEWITITGEIQKGNYQGIEIPIIQVTDTKRTNVPNEEYVYPPDNTYIPTSGVL